MLGVADVGAGCGGGGDGCCAAFVTDPFVPNHWDSWGKFCNMPCVDSDGAAIQPNLKTESFYFPPHKKIANIPNNEPNKIKCKTTEVPNRTKAFIIQFGRNFRVKKTKPRKIQTCFFLNFLQLIETQDKQTYLTSSMFLLHWHNCKICFFFADQDLLSQSLLL